MRIWYHLPAGISKQGFLICVTLYVLVLYCLAWAGQVLEIFSRFHKSQMSLITTLTGLTTIQSVSFPSPPLFLPEGIKVIRSWEFSLRSKNHNHVAPMFLFYFSKQRCDRNKNHTRTKQSKISCCLKDHDSFLTPKWEGFSSFRFSNSTLDC